MNNGMQGFSRRVAGGVKSVQSGTISIAGGASSGTATISEVNTAKSVVIPAGVRGTGSTSVDDFMHTLTLTNATTVTAQRGGSPAMNVTVRYQVIEYY